MAIPAVTPQPPLIRWTRLLRGRIAAPLTPTRTIAGHRLTSKVQGKKCENNGIFCILIDDLEFFHLIDLIMVQY